MNEIELFGGRASGRLGLLLGVYVGCGVSFVLFLFFCLMGKREREKVQASDGCFRYKG